MERRLAWSGHYRSSMTRTGESSDRKITTGYPERNPSAPPQSTQVLFLMFPLWPNYVLKILTSGISIFIDPFQQVPAFDSEVFAAKRHDIALACKGRVTPSIHPRMGVPSFVETEIEPFPEAFAAQHPFPLEYRHSRRDAGAGAWRMCGTGVGSFGG